jgi:hypothetical protein
VHVVVPLIESAEDEHDGEPGPVTVQATVPVGARAAPGPETVAVKVSEPPVTTPGVLSATCTVGVGDAVAAM